MPFYRLRIFALLLALGAFLAGCGQPTGPTEPPVVVQETPDFSRLTGKWVRTDGTYTIDVKSVAADGAAEVGYFNPRPINVSRAEAGQDEDTLKLFVELQDTGYPGCTYTLRYGAKDDRLWGVYYQAAMGQRFDVIFTRSK